MIPLAYHAAASFNGAATCSLRKDVNAEIVASNTAMLQWGRNLFVAESCLALSNQLARLECFNGAATCSLRKEWADRYESDRQSHASMGPQLVRCGKLRAWHLRRDTRATLQWGRNLFVAERSGLSCRRPCRAWRFNGAATCSLRKDCLKSLQLPTAWQLQWGRNLFVAESRESTAGTLRG